jgi:hypothetical protein
MSPKELTWGGGGGGKVRCARTADICAVVVVPNVKVKTEVQYSVHLLSLYDL